ncbi:hypothetical protein CAEBREN_17751 [Caenorhabditis brenneri]|uniref:Uncharacterized protein n=1 Tax=Caenorhabditis brenneri TaxID=135651 RepID=G0N4G2_CAEBE|nr:hypothetical protein CAEBREN_17751 [Caenorhabditis brenneri]
MSSKQNSSGQISIQSSDHILPARSENSSDQVVYIDQHFRKHVVHQVELGGLVDVALDEANEFTVFLVANLSKPAEIFISKCGITTIRLNTTVNETVEFSRDQLERLRITTDMACSENMNSTYIDISVKCEERINGTVIFGLAYPKNHLTWIATIVWFVAIYNRTIFFRPFRLNKSRRNRIAFV